MATPPKLNDLRDEYLRLFADARIKADNTSDVLDAAKKILAKRDRYTQVTAGTTIPWWVVGLIHMRESSFDFSQHLHDGSPLTARTVGDPANRPAANPQANPKEEPSEKNPYTWEESAVDALTDHNLKQCADWSLAGTLFKLEEYNGFGYRMFHSDVPSPYLWSFTTQYTKGKFIRDKVFDASFVDQEPGVAAVMAVMFGNGTATLPGDYYSYVAKRGVNFAISYLK